MKPYLLLPLALVLSLSASAQLNPIQLGIQLSPTFNYLTTDNNLIESDGTKLGLKLGPDRRVLLPGQLQHPHRYQLCLRGRRGTAVRRPVQPGEPVARAAGRGAEHYSRGGTIRRRGHLRLQPAVHRDSPGADPTHPGVRLPALLRATLLHPGHPGQFKGAASSGSPTSTTTRTFKIGSEVNALNLSWGFGGGVEYSISTQTSLIGGTRLPVRLPGPHHRQRHPGDPPGP